MPVIYLLFHYLLHCIPHLSPALSAVCSSAFWTLSLSVTSVSQWFSEGPLKGPGFSIRLDIHGLWDKCPHRASTALKLPVE